uniref:Exocyst complex component 1 n=1 Tax=Schistocephalus solidus TaxID=70667 RepID=A0A0X3PAT8_SCHSO
MLKNLPDGINLSFTTPDALEKEINQLWGDAAALEEETSEEAVSRGHRSNDGYHTLTTREEADLRRFLEETVTQEQEFNADVLMDNLRNYLTDAENSNVHFIMASENQVARLLSSLDAAMEEVNLLEKKLDTYHQFIADVEESMSGLQDRDQLAQITSDNRRLLLETLEHLVSKLSLNSGVLATLEGVDLSTEDGIERCKEAADSLDALLTSEKMNGEEHLQAVSEKSQELLSLRDSFARNLARQINNMVLRFCDQLLRITPAGANEGSYSATSGSSLGLAGSSSSSKHHLHLSRGNLGGSLLNVSGSKSVLSISSGGGGSSMAQAMDLLVAERSEMLHLSPLVGGWLQANRPDVLRELRQLYIDKMQIFFGRTVHEIFQIGSRSIAGLSKSSKHDGARPEVEFGNLLSVASGNVLNQFKPLFERILLQLSSLIYGEESFITQFFGLDDKTPETSTLNCMQMLFSSLSREMSEFIVLCERHSSVYSISMVLVLTQLQEQQQNAQKAASESTLGPASPRTRAAPSSGSCWSQLLARCVLEAKRALKRHVEEISQSFRENRPSKKTRGGLLNMVKVYESFAESTILVFGSSPKIPEVERAHVDLVRCLMTEVDRVAEESVKTPSEVVLLENYHRIYDILCRLKLPSLDGTRKEAKMRYQRALQEYSMNCMGRPLEDLHNFFDNVQAALDSGVRPEAISYQFAFQKHELQKILKEYPGKEVKKGLENLRRRVEKNLSEESNLFLVVWRSIQSEITRQCTYYEDLIKRCYADSGLALDFTISDLQNYFSEIASAPKRHALGDVLRS